MNQIFLNACIFGWSEIRHFSILFYFLLFFGYCNLCTPINCTRRHRDWLRNLFSIGKIIILYSHVVCRSSRPEMFCKKSLLKNFAKFTGKTCARVSFFKKLQAIGLRPATLLKNRLWHRCFPANFTKFLRTPFIIEHLWGLLLSLAKSFLL